MGVVGANVGAGGVVGVSGQGVESGGGEGKPWVQVWGQERRGGEGQEGQMRVVGEGS